MKPEEFGKRYQDQYEDQRSDHGSKIIPKPEGNQDFKVEEKW